MLNAKSMCANYLNVLMEVVFSLLSNKIHPSQYGSMNVHTHFSSDCKHKALIFNKREAVHTPHCVFFYYCLKVIKTLRTHFYTVF